MVGTKRMVVYDDTDPLEKLKIYDRGVEFRQPQTFGEFQLSYRMGDMHAPYLGSAEPLLLEVGHFVSCVETGAKPLTCGEFGAQVVEALELVDRGSLAMQGTERIRVLEEDYGGHESQRKVPIVLQSTQVESRGIPHLAKNERDMGHP